LNGLLTSDEGTVRTMRATSPSDGPLKFLARTKVARRIGAALLLVALAMLGFIDEPRADEGACTDFASCEAACVKGEKAACVRLEIVLTRVCEEKRQGAACAELAILYNTGGPLATSQELWVKYSSKACELGSADGCNELGVGYAQGLGGLEKNDVRAVAFFKKACELGLPLGCRNYGGRLDNGKGVTRDVPHAREVLLKACDAKDAGACTKLGNILGEGDGSPKDPEGALRLYERGCSLGDPLACDNAQKLGGHGDASPKWDVERTRTSCDAGFQLDCLELGKMYLYGRGVAVDPVKAFEIEMKSCEAKWPESCDQAARAFERGEGARRDVKAALRLYQKACGLGAPESCNHAGDLLRLGNSGGAPQPRASVEWYSKGCDLNYDLACFALGTALMGVKGVKADFARANTALEKACASGMACACNEIANSYETGRGVDIDRNRSKALRVDACKSGCKAACELAK
jgi:TPR repeat protein